MSALVVTNRLLVVLILLLKEHIHKHRKQALLAPDGNGFKEIVHLVHLPAQRDAPRLIQVKIPRIDYSTHGGRGARGEERFYIEGEARSYCSALASQ